MIGLESKKIKDYTFCSLKPIKKADTKVIGLNILNINFLGIHCATNINHLSANIRRKVRSQEQRYFSHFFRRPAAF